MHSHILHLDRTGPNSARVRDLVSGAELGVMEFQNAISVNDRPMGLIDVRVLSGGHACHEERIPAVGFMTRLSEIFESTRVA